MLSGKLVKDFLAQPSKDLSEAYAQAEASISMAEALDTFATTTQREGRRPSEGEGGHCKSKKGGTGGADQYSFTEV